MFKHGVDKKRWWAATCCRQQVPCAANGPMVGLSFGLGLLGVVMVALIGLMVLSAVAGSAGPVAFGAVAVAGGARKSVELRNLAKKENEKARAIFDLSAKENREPTDAERASFDGHADAQAKYLQDAKRHEMLEAAELGREPGAIDAATLALQDDNQPAPAAKVYPTLGHQLADIYAVGVGKATDEQQNKLRAAATGMGGVVDSEGGFAVQSDISNVIERRMMEVGRLLPLLSPVTISTEANRLVEKFIDETSRATGSRWGAIRGYWIDEGDTITASKIKLETMKTELEKLAALGYASNELLQDFSAMTSLFTQAFAEELAFLTEDAVFEGNGQGKPLGAFGAKSPCLVSVGKETNQAAATIAMRNLSKMWVRLPSDSKPKSVWMVNTECGVQLDELSIPAGTAALEPRFVNYDANGILRIKGRPVIEIPYASALGTQNDIVLADWSQYRFINKGGVQQSSSIHVRYVNDETAFRATYRVGGQPKWRSAMTPFKGSSTLSPFVTLDTRA